MYILRTVMDGLSENPASSSDVYVFFFSSFIRNYSEVFVRFVGLQSIYHNISNQGHQKHKLAFVHEDNFEDTVA